MTNDQRPFSPSQYSQLITKPFESLSASQYILDKIINRTFDYFYSIHLDSICTLHTVNSSINLLNTVVKSYLANEDYGELTNNEKFKNCKKHDWEPNPEPVFYFKIIKNSQMKGQTGVQDLNYQSIMKKSKL